MSNHSHLHQNEHGQEVDAFGLREECDLCRSRQGLPLMSELAEARRTGASIGTMQGGQAPSDELLKDLEEAEQENETLRAQLRNAVPALSRERDEAREQAATLQRQVAALEKQVAQLPLVEAQLAAARTRSEQLEKDLQAATKKK